MPTPQLAKEGVQPRTAPQCDDLPVPRSLRPVPPPDYADRLRGLLPLALRAQERFVVFEVGDPDPETGRSSKQPKQAGSDRNARSNDAATWVTFDEAAHDGRWIGVHLGDDLIGVDCDECVADDTVRSWARDIVSSLDS
jgi:hypothetical protein